MNKSAEALFVHQQKIVSQRALLRVYHAKYTQTIDSDQTGLKSLNRKNPLVNYMVGKIGKKYESPAPLLK